MSPRNPPPKAAGHEARRPSLRHPLRHSLRPWLAAGLSLAALTAFFLLLPSPAANGSGPASEDTAKTAASLPGPPAGTFAVTGARVFDGERSLGVVDVLVEDGRVAAVGAPGEPLQIAPQVPRVDGAGHTLLPGLIDCHVHAMGEGPRQALRFGVTTVLDMFADPKWVAAQKEHQAADGNPTQADVFSAGYLATVAGGHGTQFGLPVPTIDADTDAGAWVGARLAEGSDYVKIVVEDGHTLGREMDTLGADKVAELADAARAHGVLAVAHVGSRAEAHAALAAGVDGLVHLFLDEPPDDAVIAAAAADGDGPGGRPGNAFVVPTLTVLASVADDRVEGGSAGAAYADDPRVSGRLSRDQRAGLGRTFGIEAEGEMANAYAAVRRFAAAGVPILVGSDAPNPGTAHGASVHHELELLVAAGLQRAEALAAATGAPAAAFGLDDRGRIAPGRRADLVLVAGDPTADVTATRDLVAVWKAGVPADLAKPEEPDDASLPVVGPGPVSDFGDDLSASFGPAPWVPSTDQRMGGTSTVELEAVDGALRIRGEVQATFAFPWAGAFLMTHNTRMEPADLSAVGAIAFRARGATPEGGEPTRGARLMVFGPQLGMQPGMHGLELSAEWRRFEVPIADLGITDGQVSAFLIGSGTEPGTFEIWVDDVELLPADGGAGDDAPGTER